MPLAEAGPFPGFEGAKRPAGYVPALRSVPTRPARLGSSGRIEHDDVALLDGAAATGRGAALWITGHHEDDVFHLVPFPLGLARVGYFHKEGTILLECRDMPDLIISPEKVAF